MDIGSSEGPSSSSLLCLGCGKKISVQRRVLGAVFYRPLDRGHLLGDSSISFLESDLKPYFPEHFSSLDSPITKTPNSVPTFFMQTKLNSRLLGLQSLIQSLHG